MSDVASGGLTLRTSRHKEQQARTPGDTVNETPKPDSSLRRTRVCCAVRNCAGRSAGTAQTPAPRALLATRRVHGRARGAPTVRGAPGPALPCSCPLRPAPPVRPAACARPRSLSPARGEPQCTSRYHPGRTILAPGRALAQNIPPVLEKESEPRCRLHLRALTGTGTEADQWGKAGTRILLVPRGEHGTVMHFG